MDGRQSQSQAGVAAGLHETAATARELAQTLERGADTLDTASRTAQSVGEKVDRVTTAAERARDAVDARARQHPFAAVAAAFTVGFLAGRMSD